MSLATPALLIKSPREGGGGFPMNATMCRIPYFAVEEKNGESLPVVSSVYRNECCFREDISRKCSPLKTFLCAIVIIQNTIILQTNNYYFMFFNAVVCSAEREVT